MTPPRVPTARQLRRAGIHIVAYVPLPKAGVEDEPFIHFWEIARRGWPHPPFIGGRTDVNRNKVGHWMLLPEQRRYTHVAMLDADHLHQADIVERMARWVMQDRDRLVIGTLNFRRSPPYDPCLFKSNGNGGFVPMYDWQPGLVETPLMGHGAILISRKVFEQIDPPWWFYPYGAAADAHYPAEDTGFCHRMRTAGITMYCDTTITSPHLYTVGATAGTHREYRAWLEAQRES